MPRPTTPEELPEELPPLDDGDGEDDALEGGLEDDESDLDPLPAGADVDPLDDATGEGDPVDDELDPLGADTSPDDAEADDQLEVGEEAALFASEEGWLDPAAAEESEAPDEDPDLVEVEAMGPDAGEEGPLDEGEALREEDLPALDADDGGEGQDAEFFDSLTSEDGPFPWAADRWEPTPVVTHAGIGHVLAVVPAAGGACALVRSREDEDGDESGAPHGDRLVRATLDGTVERATAQGLAISAARALSTLSSQASSGGTGGGLFVLTDQAAYRSDDGGESFAVSDIAPGDDAALSYAAARGALNLPRGFELAAATHDGTDLLAVVRAHAFGRLYVVRVRASDASKRPTGEIVTELTEPESDAEGEGRLAASWDRDRGLLWLGGPFGLLALRPSRTSA